MNIGGKIIYRKILLVAISLAMLELCLRLFFGFGSVPVFVEDKDYEYILAPDQNFNRLGHHFYTNHYSMRSDALAIDDSIRILIFGDSILNGGLATDSEDLATTILERSISARLRKKIRALNISASSWGPDNAAAYLKKHGDFGAKLIILVFSSHDYFDNMRFEREVGKDLTLPDRNPPFAIADFIMGYLIPIVEYRLFPKDHGSNNSFFYSNSDRMNTGWNLFIEYAKNKNLPLLIYLHGDKEEAANGYYNEYGQKLIKFFAEKNVTCVQEIKLHPDQNFYRDFIHFNKDGQLFLANALEPHISEALVK